MRMPPFSAGNASNFCAPACCIARTIVIAMRTVSPDGGTPEPKCQPLGRLEKDISRFTTATLSDDDSNIVKLEPLLKNRPRPVLMKLIDPSLQRSYEVLPQLHPLP